MASPRTERARELRRAMSAVEWRVWSGLRGRQLEGFKFRRQAPIGPYFVDFYCPAIRLIVELAGPRHDEVWAADQVRDRYLEARGFRLLRVTADEVLRSLDDVLEGIRHECLLVRPSLTSPLRGEGHLPDPP